MFSLFETGRRMDLMMRMGDTVGADFSEALADGRLGGLELRAAVQRCAACRKADECSGWMEAAEGTAPREAPAYCRNRDLIERLAGTPVT